MRNSNKWVIAAWYWGVPAAGDNISTNGKSLYSYKLCIGRTLEDGRKVVLKSHWSVTTAHHETRASEVADASMECRGHTHCMSPNTSDMCKHWELFRDADQSYSRAYSG